MRMVGISKANVRSIWFSFLVETMLTFLPVDYNSWVESDTGRKLADSLDKDVVLAEGRLLEVCKAMSCC